MIGDLENTIGNLIDKASLTQICYLDEEGYPITKAMLKPRERGGIKTFWFWTNTSSNKVKCFKHNPKASIYIVDERLFHGISLVGTVEVLETPGGERTYLVRGSYHEGVADPDYCVLRFTATKGRFYHNFQSEDFMSNRKIMSILLCMKPKTAYS